MKKAVTGFERYSVDECGNVYGTTGIILRQRLSSNGYLRVGLRTGITTYEKPKTISIHRLVAEHFVPRIDGKNQVNHIDGNKLNNRADNLEWVSGSENMIHAIKNGLLILKPHKMHTKQAKAKSKIAHNTKEYAEKMRRINAEVGNTVPVIKRDLAGNYLEKYENCVVAARALFGTKYSTEDRLISRCARGKAKSAYGYKWCYAQEVCAPYEV